MKIYFVFPYHGVGGVSLLFLRLAQEIALKSAYDCILVDYADGYMSQRADLSLVNVLPYSDDSLCKIPGDSVLVFQAMTPWSIFPKLSIEGEARVLFWGCHPMNLAVSFPGIRSAALNPNSVLTRITDFLLRGYREQVNEFSRYLVSNDGLVFMDEPNVMAAKLNAGIIIENPCYLPIPAPGGHERRYFPVNLKKMVHFCWVGRIVDFKSHILIRLIDDLRSLASQGGREIILTVVGGGSHLGRLIIHAKESASIAINFIEHLEEKDLNAFLTNNVDVVAAMGTSALEGAKLGIPTILLDFSYKSVPNTYTYNWLFKKEGYSLGDDLTDLSMEGDSVSSLAQIINDLCFDGVAISIDTHSYFNSNHSMDIIAKKLTNALLQTSVGWGDLEKRGLIKKGILYSVFNFIKRHLKK